MTQTKKSRTVKFDKYGGGDELKIVEIDRPVPGKREVLVKLKAAGINPGETSGNTTRMER